MRLLYTSAYVQSYKNVLFRKKTVNLTVIFIIAFSYKRIVLPDGNHIQKTAKQL